MSWITDLAGSAVDTILPPIKATPEQHYRWRVRVAFVACVAFVLGCSQFAYDHGYVPGHMGFAHAREVQRLAADEARADVANAEATDNLRAEYDADVILTFALARCRSKDESAREQYDARIQARMQDYENATGKAYQLQDCGNL